MTVLENLWYGNVDPHETFLEGNRRFKKLLSASGAKRDRLSQTLSEEQASLLEEYESTNNELDSIAEVEAFSFGFRLGVRLIIESEKGATIE